MCVCIPVVELLYVSLLLQMTSELKILDTAIDETSCQRSAAPPPHQEKLHQPEGKEEKGGKGKKDKAKVSVEDTACCTVHATYLSPPFRVQLERRERHHQQREVREPLPLSHPLKHQVS